MPAALAEVAADRPVEWAEEAAPEAWVEREEPGAGSRNRSL